MPASIPRCGATLGSSCWYWIVPPSSPRYTNVHSSSSSRNCSSWSVVASHHSLQFHATPCLRSGCVWVAFRAALFKSTHLLRTSITVLTAWPDDDTAAAISAHKAEIGENDVDSHPDFSPYLAKVNLTLTHTMSAWPLTSSGTSYIASALQKAYNLI